MPRETQAALLWCKVCRDVVHHVEIATSCQYVCQECKKKGLKTQKKAPLTYRDGYNPPSDKEVLRNANAREKNRK